MREGNGPVRGPAGGFPAEPSSVPGPAAPADPGPAAPPPLRNRAIDPEGLVWTRVSPKHVSVTVLSALAGTLFWTAALGWPAVLAATGIWPRALLPWVLVPPAVALAAGGLSVLLAPRRVRALGYAERGEDLLVRRGLLYQRVTVIPYGRMQYVDVSVSPLQRAFGLATVKLHTAAVGAHAEIPGVAHAEASRLRERLTARGEALLAGL
ncbi:PH domain-containing protein [Kocuria dechangensis]|uniref:PH domain-containing protein n=1 Tax=Kocuria dechangensis TaxID=1176249 RepID=UPI0035317D6B